MSDAAWKDHVEQFWDGAHAKGSTVRLGRTKAQHYVDYFSQAGPISEHLRQAEAVLDVGPGLGNFLAFLASVGKKSLAIDVSSVSRERAEGLGATAFAPGQIGSGVADLATCLSVIQHCDEAAVKVILADVWRALRPGGQFYLNGVHGGHHNPTREGLLSGGRFSYTKSVFLGLATSVGFEVAGEHASRAGAINVWILQLVKP